MLDKVFFPELSYKVTGLCFQIHNELGRFVKERQYADRFEQLLRDNKVCYQREKRVPYKLGNLQVSGNITDFIIESKIVVELKAKLILGKNEYFQTQRYLMAGNFKLGLLVNFRDRFLKPKRILNYSNFNTKHS